MTTCPQCQRHQSNISRLRNNVSEQIRLIGYQQHEASDQTEGDAAMLGRLHGQLRAFEFVKNKMKGM